MHNFKQLKVWQESMTLAKMIMLLTQTFPTEERYGLTSQLRRCSISIPSNIAECSGRSSKKEFARFIDISIGSSYELETQVLLAIDFNYILANQTNELLLKIETVQKMLNGFRRTLE